MKRAEHITRTRAGEPHFSAWGVEVQPGPWPAVAGVAAQYIVQLAIGSMCVISCLLALTGGWELHLEGGLSARRERRGSYNVKKRHRRES